MGKKFWEKEEDLQNHFKTVAGGSFPVSARAQTTNFPDSWCLFPSPPPQRGCTEGLFRQSRRYMNLFCANMMDVNRRAEAIGYTYPTRDVFMENSRDHPTFCSKNKATVCP